MGTGGGNVPLILCKATPQANAEVCEDMAPTLSAAAGMSGNNQPIVTVPMVFSKGTRPHSKEEGQEWHESQIANTLNVFDMGESRCSEIAVVPFFGQTAYDGYEPTEQAVTLKASGGNYGGGKRDVDTAIGVDFYNCALAGGQTMTISSARSDSHHVPHVLIPYTLKIRSGCEGGGKGALIQEDKSATLACNNDQTVFVPTQTENGEVIYLARKLTPTECASLQGFEKDWCSLVPHKDAPEYKMWGNGMAFPCMLYIMEGVQKVLLERYLNNLFGGDVSDHE